MLRQLNIPDSRYSQSSHLPLLSPFVSPSPSSSGQYDVRMLPMRFQGGWSGSPLPPQMPAYPRYHRAVQTTHRMEEISDPPYLQSSPRDSQTFSDESTNQIQHASNGGKEPTTGPVKAKRLQVKNACTHCQRACKKCSNTRPCERCVKYGIRDCTNSERKPRKKGTKRGPYRRKSNPTTVPRATSPQSHTQVTLVSNGNVPQPMPPSPTPGSSALQYPPRFFYSRVPPVESYHHQTTVPERDDWLPHPVPSNQPPSFRSQPQKPPSGSTPSSHVPPPSAYRSEATSPHSSGDDVRQDTKSPVAPPKRFRDDAFAAYAQELASCLSPLAFQGNGLSSMPTSPRLMGRQGHTGGQMMPFMGHAATAPSSPSGMQLFMEMDDCPWAQGEQIGQGRLPDFPETKMPGDDSSTHSGGHDGSESLIQHPFGDLLPPPGSVVMQNATPQ